MELLSIRGDVSIERSDAAASIRPDRPLFVGQLRRLIRLRQRGRISIAGVRFYPSGASAFFGIPMHRLTDAVVPVSELGSGRLEHHLGKCADAPQSMHVLRSWLHDRLTHRPADGITDPAVTSILNLGGRTSVDEVAGQIGVTPRHLERRFRETVGLPPKLLARIVRFSRAFERVKADSRICWSQMALDSGFCDQAHFIREFRHFSGRAPSAVRADATGEYWCASLS